VSWEGPYWWAGAPGIVERAGAAYRLERIPLPGSPAGSSTYLALEDANNSLADRAGQGSGCLDTLRAVRVHAKEQIMSVVSESKPQAKQRWRPTVKQIIAAILVVAALLFIFQNTHTGDFRFLWFDFKGPVWLWMLLVFAGGIATGFLLAGRRAKKKTSA
jgi:uncharacterized integral membrane protein